MSLSSLDEYTAYFVFNYEERVIFIKASLEQYFKNVFGGGGRRMKHFLR